MSSENPFSDSQRLVDNTMTDSQRIREEYKQKAKQNINPYDPGKPQPIQQQNKKPSQMTKKELEKYQHDVQINDWKKLIDIILNRSPSTFDKQEHEAWLKNKEYYQLFQQTLQKKQNKPQPVVSRDSKEKFNPIQEPSGYYNNIEPQQEQYQQQVEQQYQQPIQQQIQQPMQQQMQIPQQYQMQQQIPQQIYPQYYQPANQHLLQTIQDLQMELQLTKSQCDRYQGDIIRTERENSQLRQQLQDLKIEKDQVQFKYQQIANVVNDLRSQMLQLQQLISQQQSGQIIQQQNEFVTPMVQGQTTEFQSKQQKTQQQNNSINSSQIDVNDVDQIMKNAEQLLGKFQDDDDKILENNYKNLLESQRLLKRQVQSESVLVRPQEQKQDVVQQIQQQNTDANSSLLPQSKYDRKRH